MKVFLECRECGLGSDADVMEEISLHLGEWEHNCPVCERETIHDWRDTPVGCLKVTEDELL